MAGVLVAHAAFWILPDVFDAWNNRITDRFFVVRWENPRTRIGSEGSVVYVDLNDRSLLEILPDFYLTRAEFARVVENLHTAGAAVTALDFIFASRIEPAADRALVDAFLGTGRAYVGLTFRSDAAAEGSANTQAAQYVSDTAWRLRVEGNPTSIPQRSDPFISVPELSRAAKGAGLLDTVADRDGVYRRAPLIVRYGDAFYPSLPFRVVCDFLQVTPDRILVVPGHYIRLSGASAPSRATRDIEIPINRRGEMLVNFDGPWVAPAENGGTPHVWFGNVWQASDDEHVLELLRQRVKGRIAVVSSVATGSSDLGVTPIDHRMPKVAVHANTIETILRGRFLRDATIVETVLLEILVLACLVLAGALLGARLFIAAALVMAAAYVAGAFASFLLLGVIVNVVRPIQIVGVAAVFTVAQRYLEEETRRRFIRRTFEAYFPPAVVERVLAKPDGLARGGERKEISVMFSDIKGFTTRCGTMDPDDVRRLLNTYFGAMVEVAFKHGATVDKFIGDGLMVFFGDPEPQPDHAKRAVRAALEMQHRIDSLNVAWDAEGIEPIAVRIGINTGEAVVGDMGSSQRLSYTALGATVNLAQRLEASAPAGGILISERTRELLGDAARVTNETLITVKGVSEPLRVYEVDLHSAG